MPVSLRKSRLGLSLMTTSMVIVVQNSAHSSDFNNPPIVFDDRPGTEESTLLHTLILVTIADVPLLDIGQGSIPVLFVSSSSSPA